MVIGALSGNRSMTMMPSLVSQSSTFGLLLSAIFLADGFELVGLGLTPGLACPD